MPTEEALTVFKEWKENLTKLNISILLTKFFVD